MSKKYFAKYMINKDLEINNCEKISTFQYKNSDVIEIIQEETTYEIIDDQNVHEVIEYKSFDLDSVENILSNISEIIDNEKNNLNDRHYDASSNMSIKIFDDLPLGFKVDFDYFRGNEEHEEFRIENEDILNGIEYKWSSDSHKIRRLSTALEKSDLTNPNVISLISAEDAYENAWGDLLNSVEINDYNVIELEKLRHDVVDLLLNGKDTEARKLFFDEFGEGSYNDGHFLKILTTKNELKTANEGILDKVIYMCAIHKSNGDNASNLNISEDYDISSFGVKTDNFDNLIGLGYIKRTDIENYKNISKLGETNLVKDLYDDLNETTVWDTFFSGTQFFNYVEEFRRVTSVFGIDVLGHSVDKALELFAIKENQDLVKNMAGEIQKNINNASFSELDDNQQKAVKGLEFALGLLSESISSYIPLASIAIGMLFDGITSFIVDSVKESQMMNNINKSVDSYFLKYRGKSENEILDVIAPRVDKELYGILNYDFRKITADSTIRNVIIGSDSDDTIIIASGNNNVVNGEDGRDSIQGSDNVDYLLGGKGRDIISSGAGNDYLEGGLDVDTYIFNKGDGHDTIYDNSMSQHGSASYSNNLIIKGYTSDQAYLTYNNESNTLEINFNGVKADKILIKDFDNFTFSSVKFDDATKKINHFYLPNNRRDFDIYDKSGLDFVKGSTDDNDINTGASNDVVYGYSGDDTVNALLV